MKKILALVLCLCTLLTLFVACGDKEVDYKLGMGVVVSMDSSATGNAQVDATVATVVTDADGKIVMCRIDVAQNKMAVANGAVKTDATFKTKMELGNDYGMAPVKIDNDGNGVTKEWFEQAKAFEEYVVGKTADEVKNMELQEKNGHKIAVDQALLDAGCSMQITDFITAVVAACNDEQGVSFKATEGSFTLGVAAKTTAAESVAATAEANGTVKMYTDFAASVVADGKIVASINDAIQPDITINAAGEIVAKTVGKKDANDALKVTKREQKELYNMATYGANLDPNNDGKVLEWYLQSAEFSKFVVGMTATEVAAMETAANSIGYQMTTNTDLLAAGCTIQITAIKAVVAQSATNAR